MSAPTALHEERVERLRSLAILAGCTRRADLGQDLLPDHAAMDSESRRLIIGDAKATETAGCTATQQRLRGYLAAALPWADSGRTVRLAICHGAGTGDWQRVLTKLVSEAGMSSVGSGTVGTKSGERVTWADGVKRISTT